MTVWVWVWWFGSNEHNRTKTTFKTLFLAYYVAWITCDACNFLNSNDWLIMCNSMRKSPFSILRYKDCLKLRWFLSCCNTVTVCNTGCNAGSMWWIFHGKLLNKHQMLSAASRVILCIYIILLMHTGTTIASRDILLHQGSLWAFHD